MKNIFKWKHYQSEIIILCVYGWSLLRNCSPMQPCWYFKYPLSYRNLQEMMQERGLNINHTTIYRWVIEYSPELNRGLRKHLKQTGDSWRVDDYCRLKTVESVLVGHSEIVAAVRAAGKAAGPAPILRKPRAGR